MVENRAVRPVDRALSCIAAGFILFFLSSTLRGYVQPQWEIPATFGIIALLFGFIREREKLRHYTLWVCWITLALVALTRIEMIFNPLGIKFQVFDNRETYAQLADTAQGRPIIFNGSYTAAAKYHFTLEARATRNPWSLTAPATTSSATTTPGWRAGPSSPKYWTVRPEHRR